MVEPIDAQNMLARTPLVEKTAATQRDNALQLNQVISQIEKEKLHQHENVQLKRETNRVEDRESQKNKPGDQQEKKESGEETAESNVTLVSEEAEVPQHKLDVTI